MKIGWAEVSITPDKKVRLAGQFYERLSQYVETPISVTALAVESGDEQMVICSCDLVGIYENLLAAVRKELGSFEGLDAEKVMIGATHTHTSMKYKMKRSVSGGASLDILKRLLPESCIYSPLVTEDDDVMGDEECLNYLTGKIACAVKEAWSSRQEGYLANAFGRVAVGMCRRATYDDGSAKMWGDTNSANFDALEGGNDSGMELMFTYDKNKAVTGVVANIACPSQVLEHRSFISSDYWGKAKGFLREKLGNDFKVLALCSAAGDQCPRDLIRWISPETPIDDPNIVRTEILPRKADPSMFDVSGAVRVGKRVANEILSAFEEQSEIKSDVVFRHQCKKIDLPVRRVTPAEYEEALKVIQNFAKETDGAFTFKDNARLHVYAGTVARYEFQQTCDLFTIESHFVRLGDIAFATNPFELFLDYGNQIRARSKAHQTFLIQLCCGSFGYLPTKRAEQGSHYSAYVSSGLTGHIGGEMLVRETLQAINKMWE